MDFILLLAHPLTHTCTSVTPEARRPSCAGSYGAVALAALAVAAVVVAALTLAALALIALTLAALALIALAMAALVVCV